MSKLALRVSYEATMLKGNERFVSNLAWIISASFRILSGMGVI